MTRKSILLADDNPDFLKSMRISLEPRFRVITANNGVDAVDYAKLHRPNLILLDIAMPKLDGIETCKAIRSISEIHTTPVLVLTGSTDENIRTQAFLAGVDDFISKPVSTLELLARLQSKLRWQRSYNIHNDTNIITLGNLILNLAKNEALLDGVDLELTKLELKLLVYFLRNLNVTLPKKQILHAVWGANDESSRTLDTHVYSLRKKLNDFEFEFATVHSVGYMLRKKI